MVLSIVIVNWNTRDLLRDCLASAQSSTFSAGFETIVVDNDSPDQSAELVESEFPEVKLVRAGRNAGYAAGNNLGFALAQGEFILALNPDTVLEPETLQLAVESLRSEPGAGALGARLVGPDGRTQPSVRGFPTLPGILGDLTGLGRLLPRSPFGSYRLSDFDYERRGDAPQPMGTFLLFRREALAAVGDPARPFDESFPIFFNEVDLLYRLRQAGWRCLYDPAVRVRHLGGASTRQVRKAMIWESHRSLLRYLRKHVWRWWTAPAHMIFALVVWIGALVRAKGYDAGFRA